jgi:hypothetical protein
MSWTHVCRQATIAACQDAQAAIEVLWHPDQLDASQGFVEMGDVEVVHALAQ